MLWSSSSITSDQRLAGGRPGQSAHPRSAARAAITSWNHLYNADVISMPDKWEYPWYAAWDLAFHCIPLALWTSISPRSS